MDNKMKLKMLKLEIWSKFGSRQEKWKNNIKITFIKFRN